MPSTKQTPKPPKGASSESKAACFVIMPFGDPFDDYYESVFRPGIEQAGLAPRRSDDLYRPSAIVHDIWTFTKEAKVVLADLTGRNPNVFYELGLAHAIAKPVVLVSEDVEDVPFDLRALRVITYNKDDPDWGSLLTEKITKSIKETLKSPARSVLPTFLQTAEEATRPVLTRHDKEILEIRREIVDLRDQIYRRDHVTRVDRLRSAEEARALMRDMIRRGYPKRLITSRLESLGAPPSWIRREVARLSTLK